MEIEITSFSNPQFKELKSLSKSRNRKREGRFLMEGRPELDTALKQGWHPQLVIFCEAYTEKELLKSFVDFDSVKAMKVSKPLFDDLAYQKVPGNFMAVFPSKVYRLHEFNHTSPVVVLESVEKPGNLGAILRTCDAAGVAEVIVTESEIDLYNPNVLRNSRGAAFTVKTVFCSNEEAFDYLRENEYQLMAAALSENARDFRSKQAKGPLALVFGAESLGLSPFWLQGCDEHIVIPMKGAVDSLNVSVSAGILIHHFTSK